MKLKEIPNISKLELILTSFHFLTATQPLFVFNIWISETQEVVFTTFKSCDFIPGCVLCVAFSAKSIVVYQYSLFGMISAAKSAPKVIIRQPETNIDLCACSSPQQYLDLSIIHLYKKKSGLIIEARVIKNPITTNTNPTGFMISRRFKDNYSFQ